MVQLLGIANPALDYRGLSVADRLQLVGDIWDSIATSPNTTRTHQAEFRWTSH